MVDQRIVLHVLRERLRISPPVAPRIFERLTELTVREPLPAHGQRSQMPVRSPRSSARFVVPCLVAGAALHPDRPVIVGTPPHEIGVGMAILSLARGVIGRVAVQTPRIAENPSDSGEGFEPRGSRFRRRPIFQAGREEKRSGEKHRQQARGAASQASSESSLISHGLHPLESA